MPNNWIFTLGPVDSVHCKNEREMMIYTIYAKQYNASKVDQFRNDAEREARADFF